jgi:hypothetical protein
MNASQTAFSGAKKPHVRIPMLEREALRSAGKRRLIVPPHLCLPGLSLLGGFLPALANHVAIQLPRSWFPAIVSSY